MGGASPAMPGIAQMPGMAGHGPGQPPLPPMSGDGHDMTDPLAALMAQFSGQGQPGMNTTDSLGKAPAQPTKPVTRLQKLMPLLHLLSVWTLLAYFVFWKEPQAFEAGFESVGSMIGGRRSSLARWAELGSGIGRDGRGVEAVVSVLQ
jgi:GET complex subunit GET2